MRTQPTESGSMDATQLANMGILADNINLPYDAVQSILQEHGETTAPVLIKVLQAFQDGFSWMKAGSVLHSDKEMALSMIQKVASATKQQLPQRPIMRDHSV